MKIGFDAAIGVHADALRLRSDRTRLLAQNIANADTPGYHARDIDFQAELDRALSGAPASQSLSVSHHRHLGASAPADAMSLKYRNPIMPSFDGNTVDAQTEQAQIAENNLQFLASLRFVDGKFKSLLGAVKGE